MDEGTPATSLLASTSTTEGIAKTYGTDSVHAGQPMGGNVTIPVELFQKMVGVLASQPQEVTYSDGSRYSGPLKEGLPHGRGIFIFKVPNPSNRQRYEGEFVEGRLEGQGILRFTNGKVFEGQFHNSQIHGEGVFKWPDGVVYVGECANDNSNGRGKLTTLNGSEIGTFRDGQLWDGTLTYGRGWQKVYRGGQSVFDGPAERYERWERYQAQRRHGGQGDDLSCCTLF